MKFYTNPKLRGKYANRVEVLDQLGELQTIPKTKHSTTKQVAEFYGVEVATLQKVIQRNREELENNGMKVMTFSSIKEEIFKVDNLSIYNVAEYGIGKRGSTIFSKRAILNIGFMLEKSKVAQEVRNQALNIIESASDEHKIFELDKEKQMLMAIMTCLLRMRLNVP